MADSMKINFVKAQYAEINNNLAAYKHVVKEDTAKTTEGNEVTEYFKGDEIRKIKVWYYGETGKAIFEYYFFNKKLIFFYTADYGYDKPIYVNRNVKVTSVKEKRYYFNGGKIFTVKYNPPKTGLENELNELSISTKKETIRILGLR